MHQGGAIGKRRCAIQKCTAHEANTHVDDSTKERAHAGTSIGAASNCAGIVIAGRGSIVSEPIGRTTNFTTGSVHVVGSIVDDVGPAK